MDFSKDHRVGSNDTNLEDGSAVENISTDLTSSPVAVSQFSVVSTSERNCGKREIYSYDVYGSSKFKLTDSERMEKIQQMKSNKKLGMDSSDDPVLLELEYMPSYVIAYRTDYLFNSLFWFACLCTFGAFYIVMSWFKTARLKLRHTKCQLSRATCLILNTATEVSCPQNLQFIRVLPEDLVSSLVVLNKEQQVRECGTYKFGDLSNPNVAPYLYSSPVDGSLWLNIPMFEFRCYRYFYNPWDDRFEEVSFTHESTTVQCMYGSIEGKLADPNVGVSRRNIFGRCEVDVEMPTITRLIAEKVFHPFYVFQVSSIALWLYDDYYQYATAIIILTSVSLLAEIIGTRKNQARLQKMAKYCCTVNTVRLDSKITSPQKVRLIENPPNFVELESTELVPGDIFEVKRGMKLPCDAIIITGTAIVNESMLTGESVPIYKTYVQPNSHNDLLNIAGQHSKHMLFSGTEIVEVRKPLLSASRHSSSAAEALNIKYYPKVVALVLRVGFQTVQGDMMRSIVHPVVRNRMNFQKETYKFVLVLALLAVIVSTVSLFLSYHRGLNWNTILKRLGDQYTIAIPPALPTMMTVATSSAVYQLHRYWNVICIIPSRINVSGRVNVVVFDKTGTLTEDGLDLVCVVAVEPCAMSHLPTSLISNRDTDSCSINMDDFESKEMSTDDDDEALSSYLNDFSKSSFSSTSLISSKLDTPCSILASRHLSRARARAQSRHCQSFDMRQYIINSSSQSSQQSYLNNPYSYYSFTRPASKPANVDRDILSGLATCHSLAVVDGQLVGEPLELQMLKFTGWSVSHNTTSPSTTIDDSSHEVRESTAESPKLDLKRDEVAPVCDEVTPGGAEGHKTCEDPICAESLMSVTSSDRNENGLSATMLDCQDGKNDSRSLKELAVVKLFEFSPVLQRMSVIVREKWSGGFKVYCKGSPEQLRMLCLPNTIPKDWSSVLTRYTEKGMRVLALGQKNLPSPYTTMDLLNKLPRKDVENDLEFLGFIVFANFLRSDSKSCVEELQRASCCTLMATGDATVTAAAVARDCGIILQSQTDIISGDMVDGELLWTARPLRKSRQNSSKSQKGPKKIFRFPSLSASRLSQSRPCTPFSSSNRPPQKYDMGTPSTAYGNTPNPLENTKVEVVPDSLKLSAGKPFDNGAEQVDMNGSVAETTQIEDLTSKSLLSLIEGKNLSRVTIGLTGASLRHLKLLSLQHSQGDNQSQESSLTDTISVVCVRKRRRTRPPCGCCHKERTPTTDLEDDEPWKESQGRKSTRSDSHWICCGVDDRRHPKTYAGSNKTFTIFEFCLRYCRLFSRMNPDDKALLVQSLQSLKEKPLVGMCGDGANDCSALKAADMGVSLSVKEASVAAPFTSNRKSVQSVVDVMREGRGALINSIQSFKFVALYGLTQLSATSVLYYYGGNHTDSQFFWVDLVMVLPLMTLMSWTLSSQRLTSRLPSRTLVASSILTSLAGQVLIQIGFQILSILMLSQSHFYVMFVPDVDDSDQLEGFENTVLFLVSNVQYMAMNFVLAEDSRPWRRPCCTNMFYLIYFSILTTLSFGIILNESPITNWLRSWLSLVSLPLEFRMILVALIGLNCVVTLLFEKVIVGVLVHRQEVVDRGVVLNDSAARNDVDEVVVKKVEVQNVKSEG